jgi:quercetin dioxygenase-like cupin family protein
MNDLKPIMLKLEGSGKFQRLLAGIPITAGMKSGFVTLKPQESIGEHKTESKEEVIIVLAGKADVYIEGKLMFSAGGENLIYIPPQTNHDIKNNNDTTLRYVYIVTPVLP